MNLSFESKVELVTGAAGASYSQMKLQMKREALQKLNRQANESSRSFDTERPH